MVSLRTMMAEIKWLKRFWMPAKRKMRHALERKRVWLTEIVFGGDFEELHAFA